MNNFFCNHKTQKSDPEHTFSEIDINYRRDYSKGKSFKVSIWNEIDTYNNDDFIQDFVIYNQSLWARIDSTPSTNEVPTEGPWTKVMDGVSDVQFKEENNKIYWKYEDESEWDLLFELDVVSEEEIKDILKDITVNVSDLYDTNLSKTSTNAVQNKVITNELNKKADKSEIPTKLSQLEADIEVEGSYDDTAIWKELKNKVDKVEGKGLSSNDFTNALKEKLEGLENYDDAEISSAVEKLSRDFNALLGNNASAAIESFNEIIAFLEGIEDSASLDAIVASIQQEIAKVSNGLADTDAKLTELSAEVSGLSEKIENLPSAKDEILVVEYGKTTFQEVHDAYYAGKYIIFEFANNVFHINRVTASDIYFISINGTIVYRVGLNSSNNWYQNTVQNEQSTNKVTTLSESSTDTQYPSAKAVYDFVSNTLGTIINGDY